MLNAATLPAITPELTEAVARYIAAKTYTASIRALVEGYQREILAAGNFQYRTWPDDKRPGSRPTGKITEPRDAWQMDDAQAEAYYALLDTAHAAHGFNIAAPGYCPLLIAEHAEIKIGWDICDAAEYITGITRDQITATLKFREYLDLVAALVMNATPNRSSAPDRSSAPQAA
jgi:hypothetical protein